MATTIYELLHYSSKLCNIINFDLFLECLYVSNIIAIYVVLCLYYVI